MFSSGLAAGNFSYIESAAFFGGGDLEARSAGVRQVQVDQDGDGTADINFLVNGASAANLVTATDFVWL